MEPHPVTLLGRESVPLWLADHAHPDPQALVAAAGLARFAGTVGDLYPGERAPVPATWGAWLTGALAAWPAFAAAELLRADFAIANRDPATLAPVQRIPHFDDSDPTIYAVLHYLCALPYGGTSFHRHRATGFERITPDRAPLWRQALAADGARHGMPAARYHDRDTATFERIGAAPLRFNRLAIYPANCLHCGDVGESWASGARLTITALVRI